MSHGNPDINALIEHLQQYVGDLDRTPADNRRAAHTLILRARKKVNDPVEAIKKLIDAIFSGHKSMEFHARNTTSFRYLVNNASRVSNDIRAARAASPLGKSREADDAFDRFYGGAGHDPSAGHQP
jgi:hypothetical protein